MAKKKVKVENAAVVGKKGKRKSTVVKKRTPKKKVTTKRKAIVAKKKPTGLSNKTRDKITDQYLKDAAKKKREAAKIKREAEKARKVAEKKKIAAKIKKQKFKADAGKGFGTKKKAPSALKKIAKVAGKTLRSPVGKFGIPGALATAAYFGYKEFAGKKPKPTPKPTPKKKPTVKKKPRGGSIGRTSMKDFKPKSKVETIKKKSTTSRYDPRKANRAGQRMGQRKAGGIIKKMKGGGRIKYI